MAGGSAGRWHRGAAASTFIALGEVLPDAEQEARTPFAPRYTKERVEEALFDRRCDLFFMDTPTLYFVGQGGATLGKRGHSKDHRPDLTPM